MTRGLGNLSNITLYVIAKIIMNKTYYIGLDVHKDTIVITYISLSSPIEGIKS